MNKALQKTVSPAHVRSSLLFADPNGEPPTVIIPKYDKGTERRGSLDPREVLIASGRENAAMFSIYREGFALVTQLSAVADFENNAEI